MCDDLVCCISIVVCKYILLCFSGMGEVQKGETSKYVIPEIVNLSFLGLAFKNIPIADHV